MSNKWIAPYILRDDYECSCCHALPPDLDLNDIPIIYNMMFEYIELIFNEFKRFVKISSAYRCPKHNRAIGGSLASVHTFGLAFDLDVNSVDDVNELSLIVDNIAPDLRMGIYRKSGTFIHIDNGYLIFPRMSPHWRRGSRWFK